ncbi:rod shape-determining protein MreD [Pseudomethylobacillus aquaticus]|uniref:Rod shape-determining protein MreD n=1 Tax=Pseudomethylobacillus aquaticus TaxID=2676064 RepID=A0A3N0UU42_9PROT|nr:rod shape-determining protein MreD [Pseudomethylobacillus aquaticus]ROH84067.1 rod shape-determining protein MreD [Pseudomethylobacillus aquaticus]
MYTTKSRFIYLSLLLALFMSMLPWSGSGLMLRPDFVMVTLIFWLCRAPHLCNIGTAWMAGLLIDLATGGLFGANAFAYSLTAFFAVIYQRRLTLFNIPQLALFVGALLAVTQITQLLLRLFAGGSIPDWHYFLPSLTGTLLWIVLALLSASGTAPTGAASNKRRS